MYPLDLPIYGQVVQGGASGALMSWHVHADQVQVLWKELRIQRPRESACGGQRCLLTFLGSSPSCQDLDSHSWACFTRLLSISMVSSLAGSRGPQGLRHRWKGAQRMNGKRRQNSGQQAVSCSSLMLLSRYIFLLSLSFHSSLYYTATEGNRLVLSSQSPGHLQRQEEQCFPPTETLMLVSIIFLGIKV